MNSRKVNMMPYVFVCGSGIMNLLLMSLPFINERGKNISGFIIVSNFASPLAAFIAIFQVFIMLLSFAMLIYGAVGILYSAGVTGVDMSDGKYHTFCSLAIVVMNLFYLFQFILIISCCVKGKNWIGMGVFSAFFLNIGIAIINFVLQKNPPPKS